MILLNIEASFTYAFTDYNASHANTASFSGKFLLVHLYLNTLVASIVQVCVSYSPQGNVPLKS